MKRLNLLLLFGGFIFQISFSQTYVPFPSESAHWNCLFWHQWEPEYYSLTNYQYLQQGDTILNGKSYKKIFTKLVDEQEPAVYIGGLREDSDKQIFFFPASINIGPMVVHTFPCDTAEQLLYTFNNLSIGMILPVNSNIATVKVMSIDSVLLGEKYRKRYEIQGNLMFDTEYWIEGIGSTKDLLSPFTYEFEWHYFTLCYSDINTYYINSPDGNDSCHYSTVIGIEEFENYEIKVFPNPASDFLSIETPNSGVSINASIYSFQGTLLLRKEFVTSRTELDIRKLNSGIYYLLIQAGRDKRMTRFIKK